SKNGRSPGRELPVAPEGSFTASDEVIIEVALSRGEEGGAPLRGERARDGSGEHLPAAPDLVGHRHAGAVGEVDRGGRVEHVQVGAGAHAEMPDVAAAQ